MIFISYSPTVISFNSCESEEKLSSNSNNENGWVFSYLSYPNIDARVVKLFLKSFGGVSNRHRFAWLASVHFLMFSRY